MKTVCSFLLLLPIFSGCHNLPETTSQSNPGKENNQPENFNTFFEQFSSDSVFQISRIQFPLAVSTYDIDANKDLPSTMKAAEWSFFNIKELQNEKKHHFYITKENDQYVVNIQLYDTGVSVNYIFQQKENKWLLVKINDEST